MFLWQPKMDKPQNNSWTGFLSAWICEKSSINTSLLSAIFLQEPKMAKSMFHATSKTFFSVLNFTAHFISHFFLPSAHKY